MRVKAKELKIGDKINVNGMRLKVESVVIRTDWNKVIVFTPVSSFTFKPDTEIVVITR